MYTIRLYTIHDYPMLQGWWKAAEEPEPSKEMLPEDTTYIMEYNDVPILSVCLYLTNCNEFCDADCFIGNPEFAGEVRQIGAIKIVEFLEHSAKRLGYKKIRAFAYKDKLKEYYPNLGFKKTVDNVASFVKEL
jgi:hypothetical protein